MMNAVIQRLLVTSFLASLSSYYGYVAWSKRCPLVGSTGQSFPRRGN